MIQITPQMRILVSIESIDFRKGIDGLCKICREVIELDPFSGYVFVFRNRKGTSIKILTYDGQGYWLCQKRLSKGRFHWWPDKSQLDVHELQLLIWNGNPYVSEMWEKIIPK
jgi:transposase